MQSDPTSFFANLFIYHCKSIWMIDLKKKELYWAHKYGNIFWFTSDLNVLGDNIARKYTHKYLMF